MKTISLLFILSFFSFMSCSENQDKIVTMIFEGEKVIIDSLPAGGTVIAKSEHVFYNVHVDPEYGDLKNEQIASEKKEVIIYELKQDATFSKMFNSLNDDLDKLCLTQSQIVDFCQKKYKYLHQDGVTFFLFKENEEFFVAKIAVRFGRKSIMVDRFDNDFVFKAEHGIYLVVPAT